MKKAGTFIFIIVILIIGYYSYHAYLRNECTKEFGIIYQQRMVDARFDKDPETATKFANDMLKLDLQSCSFK